jgi:hypothetical protein
MFTETSDSGFFLLKSFFRFPSVPQFHASGNTGTRQLSCLCSCLNLLGPFHARKTGALSEEGYEVPVFSEIRMKQQEKFELDIYRRSS